MVAGPFRQEKVSSSRLNSIPLHTYSVLYPSTISKSNELAIRLMELDNYKPKYKNYTYA